jgi:hypothetical protein
MNLPDERWSKFKQELIPIIYLSILHVVWVFNYTSTMRFTSPLSIVLATMASIAGILANVYCFTFADTFAPGLDLPYLDAVPYSETWKKIHKITVVALLHVGFLIYWYKDYDRMPNAHYVAKYILCLTAWILFYRAMRSKPVEQ